MNSEMKDYQEKLKKNIYVLIENNRLKEAKELVNQYENIISNDIEVYSIKSVIAIMEGNDEEAESILNEGLIIDEQNFDLNYNMAYIYHRKNSIDKAIEYYKLALDNVRSEEEAHSIYVILQQLGVKEYNEIAFRNKITNTSIIILTYNNLKYNKLCIDSIRNYTSKGTYEIIVIDNHSTDGTVEWLKQQSDLKVIFNEENLGFPKGCNQGIKIAQKDNDILLLNNDTVVTPNWLTNLKKCLYSNENIGAVGSVTNSCSNYQTISVDYKNLDGMINFATSNNISSKFQWEERLRLVGFCMLIKSEVVKRVGLLDEIFTPGNFEDDDYSFRIRKSGYRLILCKDSFIHHFGSVSFGKVSKEYSELIIKNRKKFFEKWGFDPYHITDIRKDITELIIKSNKKNVNILHVGCRGGGTLLDIKNSIPSAKLYGIDAINEAFVDAEYFTQIELGNVDKIKNFEKNHFEYIITQSQESEEEIINILSTVKNYLREDGIIYIIVDSEKLYSNTNLIRNLEARTDSYIFKSIRNNKEQILIIEKTKRNKKDSICKLSIYKKQDIENVNKESILDYNQVEGGIEQILIRRLDNNLEFEKNLDILRKKVINNKVDYENIKDVILNLSINKVELLNIIGILCYESNVLEKALMLLRTSFKLDNKNKETIYNIAFILFQIKENKMALDFLIGIDDLEKDEGLNSLRKQIEETI